MIHSGVLAARIPGITNSRFNPTESRGFSNNTVMAHIAARHGSIVRNSPIHHFKR